MGRFIGFGKSSSYRDARWKTINYWEEGFRGRPLSLVWFFNVRQCIFFFLCTLFDNYPSLKF